MNDSLRTEILGWLKDRVDAVGFAPVERFDAAPSMHHPSRICQDAMTVIVFGRLVPKGVLSSPEYSLYLLHRSYHTLYPSLDELSTDLANRIEAQGYLAVQIPSFGPLVYHGDEPWGILSLKHAAVLAGLGGVCRNGLLYHPNHGSLLRLAAVVTNAKMSGDRIIEEACPPGCNACQEACPVGAFQNGSFRKAQCIGHSIRHAIYPLALRTEAGRKNIEIIFNTAGYNAWIRCHECQRLCPKNRRKDPSPSLHSMNSSSERKEISNGEIQNNPS